MTLGFTMNHRTSMMLALFCLGGTPCCTQTEYTTLFPGLDGGPGSAELDAGERGSAGDSSWEAGGAGAGDPGGDSAGAGGAGDGLGGAGSAGAGSGGAGSVGAGSGGAGSGDGLAEAGTVAGCTGCVRLSGSGDIADYQLQLGTTWDLTGSVIIWRARVRNFSGEVSVVPYVQSGDGAADEARLPSQALTAGAGWRELALDLRVLDGGVPAGELEAGAAFDGSHVRRVGIAFQLPELAEAATAVIELDAVTFSGIPGLSSTFANDQGGFRLVDSPGFSATLVTE